MENESFGSARHGRASQPPETVITLSTRSNSTPTFPVTGGSAVTVPLERQFSSPPCFGEPIPRSANVIRSPSLMRKDQQTAQLTIFYNGLINVYDVDADKAQAIMELASWNSPTNSSAMQVAMPISSQLSLKRFLDRRKDRLLSLSAQEPKDSQATQQAN